MTLPPLPKCTNRTGIYKARWWHEHPLYDADQMRDYATAAVQSEREAIAQWLDDNHAISAGLHNYWAWAAREIRARKETK